MSAALKGKTAIICVGGGMRSAHGAGFLYAMATQLSITKPDIIIGSSGDAGNVAYFAAGQYESMKRIWRELLSTPKFISFLRPWKIMDIDYLIDTVFKKLEPLDTTKLTQSPISWFVAVTRVTDGEVCYVSTQDTTPVFDALRASKALPVFYGRTVLLGGEAYYDGQVHSPLSTHIAKAQKEGASRILIIEHGAPTTHVVLPPESTLIRINPTRLEAGRVTRNKQKLRKTFEQGIADALTIKDELRALFLGDGLDPAQKSPVEL